MFELSKSQFFLGDSPSIVRACECWIKTIGTMDFILINLRNVMSFCFCRPCFSLTSCFPSGVRPLLLISYHMTTIRQSEQSSLLETVLVEEYHNHLKTFLLSLKLCKNVVYCASCLQGNYSSKRWQDGEIFNPEVFILFCHLIVKFFIKRHQRWFVERTL